MITAHKIPQRSSAAQTEPRYFHSLMFFALRHYPETVVVLALLSGISIASIAMLLAGRTLSLTLLPFGFLFVAGIMMMAAPLIGFGLGLNRTASTGDIAAFLAAGTQSEKPLLAKRIERRLSSRIATGPISRIELVLIFQELRSSVGQDSMARPAL